MSKKNNKNKQEESSLPVRGKEVRQGVIGHAPRVGECYTLYQGDRVSVNLCVRKRADSVWYAAL